MRIAVLGTGTMGAGVAASLLRAGHDVTVWNRNAERTEPLVAAGATAATDPAAAVANAEVVIDVLFDEPAVAEIARVFVPAMADGAIWLQSATVGPAGARRLAAIAAEHGVTTLDAPLVGTKKPAQDGTLVVLLSGDRAAIERVAPVTDAIGSKVVVAGPDVGDASALKLACNAWVASITAAIGQSLALASSFGVDPSLVLTALAGGASDSPYAQLKGGAMLADDYTPSFAVAGLAKDLGLMLRDAGDGFDPSWLAALHDRFEAAADAGHASEDIAAVGTTFRR